MDFLAVATFSSGYYWSRQVDFWFPHPVTFTMCRFKAPPLPPLLWRVFGIGIVWRWSLTCHVTPFPSTGSGWVACAATTPSRSCWAPPSGDPAGTSTWWRRSSSSPVSSAPWGRWLEGFVAPSCHRSSRLVSFHGDYLTTCWVPKSQHDSPPPSMHQCLWMFSLPLFLLFLCSMLKVGALSGLCDVHQQCDFLLCPVHPLHPPLLTTSLPAPPPPFHLPNHPSIHPLFPSCTKLQPPAVLTPETSALANTRPSLSKEPVVLRGWR